MSLWRQLTRGVRAIRNRGAADRDVADEVQHYLEQATAALLASGLSPDDARKTARLETGNAAIIREQVRSYGWENVIGTLFADLRFATRQLLHDPGFALISVLTLGTNIFDSSGCARYDIPQCAGGVVCP
jgi:hypothetical protein